MKLVFCDVLLFDGLNYDAKTAQDHFFRNQFVNALKYIENDKNEVEEYEQFVKKFRENSEPVYQWAEYISKISKSDNNDLKWNVIVCFHLLLLCFLNDYGYEFQVTDNDKMKIIISKYKNFILKENLSKLININRLNNVKAIKSLNKLL